MRRQTLQQAMRDIANTFEHDKHLARHPFYAKPSSRRFIQAIENAEQPWLASPTKRRP